MVLDELFLDKIKFCRKKDILRLQTAVLTQKGMFVPYFVVLEQTITFILNSIFNISGTFNFLKSFGRDLPNYFFQNSIETIKSLRKPYRIEPYRTEFRFETTKSLIFDFLRY